MNLICLSQLFLLLILYPLSVNEMDGIARKVESKEVWSGNRLQCKNEAICSAGEKGWWRRK